MQSFEKIVNLDPAAAEAAVRATLAEQGFGVLTEIDVAATLAARIGVERPALKILGACNPHFAHEALTLDPTVGLMLPCNVVVESVAGGTRVAAVDPRALMDAPEFRDLAERAAEKLKAAIDALEA